MSDRKNDDAPGAAAYGLLELVDEIRQTCPSLTLDQALTLATSALYTAVLDDVIVVLGDIADALNDMRPVPGERKLH